MRKRPAGTASFIHSFIHQVHSVIQGHVNAAFGPPRDARGAGGFFCGPRRRDWFKGRKTATHNLRETYLPPIMPNAPKTGL